MTQPYKSEKPDNDRSSGRSAKIDFTPFREIGLYGLVAVVLSFSLESVDALLDPARLWFDQHSGILKLLVASAFGVYSVLLVYSIQAIHGMRAILMDQSGRLALDKLNVILCIFILGLGIVELALYSGIAGEALLGVARLIRIPILGPIEAWVLGGIVLLLTIFGAGWIAARSSVQLGALTTTSAQTKPGDVLVLMMSPGPKKPRTSKERCKTQKGFVAAHMELEALLKTVSESKEKSEPPEGGWIAHYIKRCEASKNSAVREISWLQSIRAIQAVVETQERPGEEGFTVAVAFSSTNCLMEPRTTPHLDPEEKRFCSLLEDVLSLHFPPESDFSVEPLVERDGKLVRFRLVNHEAKAKSGLEIEEMAAAHDILRKKDPGLDRRRQAYGG
ncbi:MAG: hypothetical protein ACWA5T_06060 [Parvularcula sp.]